MKISDEMIIDACRNSSSMSRACAILKMNYNTFSKRAKLLNVYKPNQSGKGVNKDMSSKSIPLNEILEGKHPQFQSNKLRVRLLKEGIKDYKCECCSNTIWNGKPIPLELNHIDGNCHNHILSNLEIICPNCHSQTSTFRGRNINKLITNKL